MRFNTIETLKITDLHLDQGNYRFTKADDQRECIEKIYTTSPEYFRNMMESIAEDDIGELLLVYTDAQQDKIVMDGNRRLAALKVLFNPDLAPTDALRKRAIILNEDCNINFDAIQAQSSSNKNAVLRTIYERHGSSRGKSRLSWSALAKSRFNYDENIDLPGTEWKVIALIYKIEELFPDMAEIIDSKNYKHDVFRRIVPAAIKSSLIKDVIFSARDKRIKVSQKKNTKLACNVCVQILNDIKDNVIGLNRKNGIYADSEGIERYLKQFEIDNSLTVQEDSDLTESSDDPTESTELNNNQTESGTNPVYVVKTFWTTDRLI